MTTLNPIQLQKYLKGIDYPVSKQELIQKAQENGADESVLSALEQFPDQDYETPTDVSEAVADIE